MTLSDLFNADEPLIYAPSSSTVAVPSLINSTHGQVFLAHIIRSLHLDTVLPTACDLFRASCTIGEREDTMFTCSIVLCTHASTVRAIFGILSSSLSLGRSSILANGDSADPR